MNGKNKKWLCIHLMETPTVMCIKFTLSAMVLELMYSEDHIILLYQCQCYQLNSDSGQTLNQLGSPGETAHVPAKFCSFPKSQELRIFTIISHSICDHLTLLIWINWTATVEALLKGRQLSGPTYQNLLNAAIMEMMANIYEQRATSRYRVTSKATLISSLNIFLLTVFFVIFFLLYLSSMTWYTLYKYMYNKKKKNRIK